MSWRLALGIKKGFQIGFSKQFKSELIKRCFYIQVLAQVLFSCDISCRRLTPMANLLKKFLNRSGPLDVIPLSRILLFKDLINHEREYKYQVCNSRIVVLKIQTSFRSLCSLIIFLGHRFKSSPRFWKICPSMQDFKLCFFSIHIV